MDIKTLQVGPIGTNCYILCNEAENRCAVIDPGGDAPLVAAAVEKKFPHLQGRVEIYPIGATIGSHTGPGTLALFFWGDERKN